MWSSVLVLALPMAFDPVRLGINLLMISRPRAAQNLLVYWVGCVVAGVAVLLVPLMVLHFTPMFSSYVQELARPATTASSTVRHGEIFMGVLALSIAALMAVRFLARRRAQVPASVGRSPGIEPPIERLLGRGQDAAKGGGSAVRRMLGCAHKAWENGSLWVALVIGFWAGPPPSLVIPVLAAILASGAAIGTQIGAATAFVVATLAVVEIILVINLAAPTRTQAVLRPLHDWVLARRPQVLVVVFTLVGVTLVAQGIGSM